MKLKLRGGAPAMDYSASMTDLSFLLIVFFMIAAVFVADEGLVLRLPAKDEKPLAFDANRMLILRLGENGFAELDGRETDPQTMASSLRNAFQLKGTSTVLIVSGEGVSYQRVLDAVSLCREAGGKTFSLVSEGKRPVPLDLGKERGP